MRQSVDFATFVGGFSTRRENFSHAGLRALFNYYEDLEEELNTPIMFDPIAICCEWAEYDSVDALLEDYSTYVGLEDIQDMTTVVKLENGHVLIQV